jgi:hypothetical protein
VQTPAAWDKPHAQNIRCINPRRTAFANAVKSEMQSDLFLRLFVLHTSYQGEHKYLKWYREIGLELVGANPQ